MPFVSVVSFVVPEIVIDRVLNNITKKCATINETFLGKNEIQ